ncbi:glutamate decarboxylase beta [Escherichia coli]|uniref:glutamate decarboxylase n=1 Tax=Escherichia coli TaxID=562 RepID=A0A484X992_ECOLX|nr:glutamate decarboxylase beta [Escherichia coli]
MDKKQVTDLRSELLDSRFGAKSISTIAESKRFPLHEMRDDVAFQIINDELYLDGNARQNWPLSARPGTTIMSIS